MESNQKQQAKIPSEEVKQLEIFIGKWKVDGKNFPIAPGSGETPVYGEENYEWLNGNFYIQANWKHLFDEGGHIGASILGYNEEEKKLFARNFDNLGFERKYILEKEDNNWNFIGDQERASKEFSNDGKQFTEHWEMKNDQGEWTPLCVMNGIKV